MDAASAESITLPAILNGPESWPLPVAFSTLWQFLLSSTALREGAKLFLVGSILELTRRAVAVIWASVIELFFINVEFEDRDETFTWMMFWLSRQPRWNNLRSVRVTTFRYGQSGVANLVPGEDGENKIDASRKVAYVPSHSKSVTLWCHRTWMRVTLVQTQGDIWNRRGDERLKITLFAWSLLKLDELLLEAKQSYKKHSEGRINIYVSDSGNDWTLACSRPRRPLGSVVLDRKLKSRLLADAKDFIASEKWYAARGIPWRRGYLLHGSPGSGKTSLIHSLAGELGLDVYVVSLSKKSLDDTSLNELISKIPPKSLALMEDIDAAFYRGVSRETESTGVPLMPGQPPGELTSLSGPVPSSFQAPMQSASGVTLSGLLGAIDGVAAQEGRLLFATTNKYGSLDPALIRPGRLDVHVRFDNAGRQQAAQLFRCFFRPSSEDDTDAETEEDLDDESDSDCSTFSTAASTSACDGQRTNSAMEIDEPGVHSLNLSWEEIKRLSSLFAKRMPEREFSMAALQGLLMQYKSRPYDVIDEVDAWVAEERRKRREREGAAPSIVIQREKITESSSSEKEIKHETMETGSGGEANNLE